MKNPRGIGERQAVPPIGIDISGLGRLLGDEGNWKQRSYDITIPPSTGGERDIVGVILSDGFCSQFKVCRLVSSFELCMFSLTFSMSLFHFSVQHWLLQGHRSTSHSSLRRQKSFPQRTLP